MRRRSVIIGSSLSLLTGAAAASKPVVLELFTSQGCSSCPPADALLGELSRRENVISLAWHVDYWDHLGWHDKFASKAATARQRTYAARLGGEVFTPALVVNGTKVLVGSDRTAIEAAVASAATLPVTIGLRRVADAVAVDFGQIAGRVLARQIVYDPEHATDIGSGENGGARLREYRVVRAADALGELDGSSRSFLARLPEPGQGMTIILQSTDLRVLGAADLPPS